MSNKITKKDIDSESHEDISGPPEDGDEIEERSEQADFENEETVDTKEEKITEDDKKETDQITEERPITLKAKILSIFSKVKNHKKLLSIILVIILLITFTVPFSRYFLFNTFGIRASASFKVVNSITGQPIKNVEIELANKKGLTDDNGELKLKKIKLGATKLVISKLSYAKIEQKTIIGLGSNPYDQFKMDPVGVNYSFIVRDWLSKAPLKYALITVNDSTTLTDKDGKAILTFDPEDSPTVKGNIKLDGFKVEDFEFSSKNKEEYEKDLIAAYKNYYLTNRSGTYDIYSINEDGRDDELILKGTGKERQDLKIMPNNSRNYLAYVSTRDGSLNSSSFALSSLYLIDTITKKLEKISESESIMILGWSNDTLVFKKIKESYSGSTPDRNKIYSYNTKTKNLQELIAADYFSEVYLIDDTIYYVAYYQTDLVNEGWLESIDINGENKKILLQNQTWGLIRSSFDSFSLSTNGNKWFSYKLGDSSAKEITTPTEVPNKRSYVGNLSNTKHAWLDYRDGKGTILIWDGAESKDKIIYAKGGIVEIKNWLNDTHLIYVVSNNEETADYVVEINSGLTKKITNSFYRQYGPYGY